MMSRQFGLKLVVAAVVWGVGVSLYGTIVISNPTTTPKVEILQIEALAANGTCALDDEFVQVVIRKNADAEADDEVDVQHATDKKGNWGGSFSPGVWDYANTDYNITVSKASSRIFKVTDLGPP